MMCASHSGEAMHVAQVQEMLGKAGLTYQRLQCGCHVPMFVELGVAPAPAQYDERNHNCSGKHSRASWPCACSRAGRWKAIWNPHIRCSRRSGVMWRARSAWRPMR